MWSSFISIDHRDHILQPELSIQVTLQTIHRHKVVTLPHRAVTLPHRAVTPLHRAVTPPHRVEDIGVDMDRGVRVIPHNSRDITAELEGNLHHLLMGELLSQSVARTGYVSCNQLCLPNLGERIESLSSAQSFILSGKVNPIIGTI